MVSTAYNTHQRQFVHSDDFYFQRTRRLKVKKRLTQRAPDPRQRTLGHVVGVCAFSGSLCGSKLIPAKWRCLVPPIRG
jgi:hypothetical protein